MKAYENDENRGKAILRLQLLLGTAQAAAGELILAEEILSDVRSRIVEAWGWNHVATIACVKSLTKVLEGLGQYDEAQTLYEAAIEGVRHTMGCEYPWTLELSTRLACFCARRSDFGRARDLLNDSYNAKRHVLGHNHQATLDTLCNLARLPIDEDKRWHEQVLESAVAHFRERYGDHDPKTKRAAKHVISLHLRAGNSEKAQKLCNELQIQGNYISDSNKSISNLLCP